VCYLAKLWKKTKGHRNHQAKNNGSTNMPNRSDYHGVSLDKLCPEILTADFKFRQSKLLRIKLQNRKEMVLVPFKESQQKTGSSCSGAKEGRS